MWDSTSTYLLSIGIRSLGAVPLFNTDSRPAQTARSVAVAILEPAGPSCIRGWSEGFGVAEGKGTALDVSYHSPDPSDPAKFIDSVDIGSR